MTRGASWLGLALAAAVAGCAACSGATYTIRHGSAAAPGPASPAPAGALRVLHLADFGENTPQQAGVAAAVAAAHRRAPFALALFPGDNLYDCGPDAGRPGAEACTFGPDGNTVATPPVGGDPSFARLHEGPLAALAGPGPAARVLLSLGNHDVATWPGCGTGGDPGVTSEEAARRKACLEVAHQAPLWSMPGRHYLVDEGPARFIFLDSNAVYADYGGFTLEDELRFVAEAARGCQERLCFLVAHHPPVTAGVHVRDFGTASRGERMARLLAAAGPSVRAWLAGHDHDLQHLRTAGGLDVLVSGNGSSARPSERFERVNGGGTLLFASVRPGLGVLTVHPGGWRYRFEDTIGEPLHCCEAAGRGPCEPVRCSGPAPEAR